MNVLRSVPGGLVFHLAKREKRLFLDLLKVYPVPSTQAHELSKSEAIPDGEASRRLLEEALAEHRAENKRQLEALLAGERRFVPVQSGWELTLSHEEIEALLQIMNDIRVGSWEALGCPEAPMELSAINPKTAPRFWAMELSGHFEMELLRGLTGHA